MDYKILETWQDNDKLCVSALLVFDKGEELVVTVPVKLPKTELDVLAAIDARCKAEQAKYDYAAIITPVKIEVDKRIGQLTKAVV